LGLLGLLGFTSIGNHFLHVLELHGAGSSKPF